MPHLSWEDGPLAEGESGPGRLTEPHAIVAALRDLATHLETLEASLVRAGATVHWARDAEEACAIVAQVAHAHGVDEVVKVK